MNTVSIQQFTNAIRLRYGRERAPTNLLYDRGSRALIGDRCCPWRVPRGEEQLHEHGLDDLANNLTTFWHHSANSVYDTISIRPLCRATNALCNLLSLGARSMLTSIVTKCLL